MPARCKVVLLSSFSWDTTEDRRKQKHTRKVSRPQTEPIAVRRRIFKIVRSSIFLLMNVSSIAWGNKGQIVVDGTKNDKHFDWTRLNFNEEIIGQYSDSAADTWMEGDIGVTIIMRGRPVRVEVFLKLVSCTCE